MCVSSSTPMARTTLHNQAVLTSGCGGSGLRHRVGGACMWPSNGSCASGRFMRPFPMRDSLVLLYYCGHSRAAVRPLGAMQDDQVPQVPQMPLDSRPAHGPRTQKGSENEASGDQVRCSHGLKYYRMQHTSCVYLGPYTYAHGTVDTRPDHAAQDEAEESCGVERTPLTTAGASRGTHLARVTNGHADGEF